MYSVTLVKPGYGEVKVVPCVLNEDQYLALLDFADSHDEIVVVEDIIP